MELHERLSTSRPVTAPSGPDPFADVKNRIHLAVIGELGPQLFNSAIDPITLRERVIDDIRAQLAEETGISRDDRERLVIVVGAVHGPDFAVDENHVGGDRGLGQRDQHPNQH